MTTMEAEAEEAGERKEDEEDDGTKYTHKHNTHRITNIPPHMSQ